MPLKKSVLEFKYDDYEDFIVVNKPSGISTHSSGKLEKLASYNVDEILIPGLIERVSSELKIQLYVVHRLDKETSGAIIFAKTKKATESFRQLFTNKKIIKNYIFLTDKHSELSEINCDIPINDKSAFTRFEKIKSTGVFNLWRATPLTGRTHQIRIHACRVGIPVLGCKLYDGTKWPRLMLHSEELIFENSTYKVSEPIAFTSNLLSKSEDIKFIKTLTEIISSFDRRNCIFKWNESSNLRLVHAENLKLRIDKLGKVLCLYWYSKTLPEKSDIESIRFLSKWLYCDSFIVMNHSKSLNNQELTESFKKLPLKLQESSWYAFENNLKFEFKANQRSSPGLFLDQRLQRRFIQLNSKDKRVLKSFFI